jgi:transposase
MLIIGCDFHTRFQQIAMVDPTTGEIIERRLEHENGEAEKFCATLPSPARVGIEATINAQWFERMLSRDRHELCIGDTAEIRAARVRKQKTDSRDALHILGSAPHQSLPADLDSVPQPSVMSGSCCGIDTNWFPSEPRG